MKEDEVKAILLRILAELAPEEDVSRLKDDVRIRDQLDLDSMDFLNFLIAVDEELNVDIPEADYPKLRTLNDCVAYVQARLAESAEKR
jgi:acyl carrier protein